MFGRKKLKREIEYLKDEINKLNNEKKECSKYIEPISYFTYIPKSLNSNLAKLKLVDDLSNILINKIKLKIEDKDADNYKYSYTIMLVDVNKGDN